MNHALQNADVLVVGDVALPDQNTQSVVRVANYLQAMGELGQRVNTKTLIGDLAPMSHALPETIGAMRRLAPELSWVVVADPSDEPEAMRAVRLGCDRYVLRPESEDLLSIDLKAEPASAPNMASVSSPDVGDGPLLQVLLDDAGDLLTVALDRIRARTGDVTVRWDASAAALRSDRLSTEQLAPQARWLDTWLKAEQQWRGAREDAEHDALTGVWNRRGFDRLWPAQLEEAARRRHSVTLMLWDIDRLKAYNDVHGHAAGDAVLRHTAALMRRVVREQDIVARFGGDEFAVIFPETEAPRRPDSEHRLTVQAIVERFRAALSATPDSALGPQGPGAVSISAGLATFPWDGHTVERLFELADQRLREAKAAGRDQARFGPSST